MNDYTTIIITLATVLTSAGAWQFWQKRLKLKHKRRKHNLHRLLHKSLRYRQLLLMFPRLKVHLP